MSKSVVLTLVTVALLGLLIYLGLSGVDQVTCEVCVTFKSETVCRTGQGRTEDEAIRTATESACAVMATTSMAERIKCGQSEPTSSSCR